MEKLIKSESHGRCRDENKKNKKKRYFFKKNYFIFNFYHINENGENQIRDHLIIKVLIL